MNKHIRLYSILGMFLLLMPFYTQAQHQSYIQDLKNYQTGYILQHEVVDSADKKLFSFYAVDAAFKVKASFTKLNDTSGFTMKTSGSISKHFFRYGLVKFRLKNQDIKLTVYRSQALLNDTAYQDYLFLPFTDLTSGEESYGGGRYIDLRMREIENNYLVIDFNKAYNPYCAYANGYNCPIPPRENDISIAIEAGEKAFGKPIH